MLIEIPDHSAERVQRALKRRAELLKMTTCEMPRNWQQELATAEHTISAAVSVAAINAAQLRV